MSDAFLGRGWSFPPTFRRPQLGVDMLEDEADVASSLAILLSTARGERVMNPLYGCNVESLLFEPLDTRQKTLLKDMIETAILYHEPRVQLEEVDLRDDQALEGVVVIAVTYRVKSTNSRFNVVFPFYANEGTDVNLTSSVTLLAGERLKSMGTSGPCLPDVDAQKPARDGTEQGERFPAPLDPASVPVHGRTPAHSMLFARAYAEHLRYWSPAKVEDGDWRDFFGTDVSVALAAAAVQDVDRYRSVLRKCIAALEDRGNLASPDVVRHNLGFIFGAVGTLATQIDALAVALPEDLPLAATVASLIRGRLAAPLARLISYAAFDASLPAADRLLETPLVVPEPSVDHELSILGVAPVAFGEMLLNGLSGAWIDGAASWTAFVGAIAPDGSVFGTGSVFERANRCAGHNLFSGACDQFLMAYARLVSDAAAALETTLQSYDRHDPHYALLLAFLRSFEHARSELNALSGKHLDFYYRDVLQLAEGPPQASEAHLLVELARNAQSFELAAGTEFKAGKDATKVPVVFTSDASLVANKAVVASVMNLYRDAGADVDAIYVNAATRDAAGSWQPFRTDKAIGRFGFSVASHYLWLAEGTRTITLTLNVKGTAGADAGPLVDAVTCRFTTAKAWLEVAPVSFAFVDPTTLVLVVELAGGQPPVTAFDAKVHASAYAAALPVLEVRWNPAPGMLSSIRSLESLVVGSIDLQVEVDRVRSLVLSTDVGPADASKPFQPFGPAPIVGSSLVIGCQEAFSKKNLLQGALSLSLAWRNWSSHPKPVRIDGLVAGEWLPDATQPTVLQSGTETIDLPDFVNSFNPTDDPSVVYAAPFGLQAATGYFRLNLQGTLGHETYAKDLADYVAAKVRGDSPAPPAPDVYTPELESITLAYAASQHVECGATDAAAFDGRTARFHHLAPFGLAEQHGFLRAGSEETGVPLLPPMRHLNVLDPGLSAGTAVPHEGELYIGLAGVAAPQNVTLLFQVEDGTADPLTEKPHPHLHFSYLRNGDWVAFDRGRIADGTSELLASGIITVPVPRDATTTDTLLPGGLVWLRIAVADHTLAVCRVLAVLSQALRVTFADRGNDPGFLATPVAPGTIAKLVTPVAAVKSVAQPYESFGGHVAESPRSFYTRVSERLRHKDRAVALWDIERLVLQAVPGIHRVKCLDHTRYEPSASGEGIYRELAAGHITVVAIPAVSAGYAADPLAPYVSLGVLEQIKTWLEARLSCFATLHVCNPSYERVRVACNVRLRESFDETQSLAQLRTAVAQFLAPWAFDTGRRPSFGGKIYRAAIISLIEKQRCVDYVTDVRLYLDVGGVPGTVSASVVEPTRAVSVLTSVPAEQHQFTAIDAKDAAAAAEDCGCSA